MNELLDQWDDELSVESVVSRLLHLSPTEKNFIAGCQWIETIISERVRELSEVEQS